ncbi:hypothetical protein GCM10027284_09130 [Cyclobacterium sediminis]
MYEEIPLKLKTAASMKEFIDPVRNTRRMNMVYFQKLENGTGLITRVVSDKTDKIWLSRMIKQGKILLQPELNIAETS